MMATAPRGGLLDRWLTINNQGNDSSSGEGDGAGLTTDWGRMLSGLDMYDAARGFGYGGAMPSQGSGEGDGYQQGNPQQELFDWMRSSGYNYGINPTFNGGQFNAWLDPQGNEVEGTRREFAAPNEGAFNIATALLAGAGGGFMGAGLGLGSAGAGAMAGGAAAGTRDASLESILSGAALGGLTGYGMDQFMGAAPDAMGDYMRTGASEGSTIGNAYTGAGGQAGAVGANSIAAQMAIPSDFDPSSLFQNVADPTNALQQLPDMAQMPGQMPSMGPGEATPFRPSQNYGGGTGISSQLPQVPEAMARIPQGEFWTGDMGAGQDLAQSLANLPQLPQVPAVPFPSLPQSPASQQNPQQPAQPDPAFRPSQNYGDGMTGNQTGAYDAVIGATGSAGLANAAAGAAGGIGGLVDSLGGLKTILPIAGAIAGSQPSGGGTTTRESKTDPRFDPYLYGDGGFLPSAKSWFDANKSGSNETMRAGWAQQLGLLNDPQIAQQLTGMRNQGLLQSQAPIAGNPFTSGQMSLPNGGGGLLGGWGQQPQGPQAGGPGGQIGGAPSMPADWGQDPRRNIAMQQPPQGQQPPGMTAGGAGGLIGGPNPSGYIPGRDYGGGVVSSGGLGYDPSTGGPVQYTAPDVQPGQAIGTYANGKPIYARTAAQEADPNAAARREVASGQFRLGRLGG